MEKLVSVIMPVYNAERFVEQAIRSVLDQTYVNIELMVVDDGSTDRSWEIISSIQDARMHAFRQINQGACVARNRGISESKGEYLKFLDADDVLYPDAIETQVEQMSHLGEDEEVFGDFDIIDAEGKVFFENHINAEQFMQSDQNVWFLTHWYMLTGTPLHRREWIEKVGGFDVHLRRHQESSLHFSLSMAGVHFVYMPGRIFQYRSFESADRITTKAITKAPQLSDVTNRWDTFWKLTQAKYGDAPSRLSTLISQNYFAQANSYFAHGMVPEGKYCLQRAKEIPHGSHYPRYRRSHSLYYMYLIVGWLFGYARGSHIADRLASLMGHKARKDRDFEKVKNGNVQQ